MISIEERAFNCLTPLQRKAWTLCMRQGITQDRAGKILGISRSAVKDRLDKGRRKYIAYIKKLQGSLNVR